MSVNFAKSLRARMTDAERALWYLLRDRRLQGYKFRRQMPVGPYVVDFICLEHRLIIELDGGQHADQTEKDAVRDDWFRSQKFVVLRFWNNDALSNTEGVLQVILEHCETFTPHPYSSPARGEGNYERPPVRGEGSNSSHGDRLRRLRWRCRRGLLELDLWLQRFADARLEHMSAEECRALEALLEEADADLLAWLEGRQRMPPGHVRIIELIRAST
jgi:very-short-patch-repair endonuclease/succinate dehydrogenase flavin-adding protein (antitoxin of CptAB toxin-antitoxin module)